MNLGKERQIAINAKMNKQETPNQNMKIEKNKQLMDYNTFRAKATAEYFVQIESPRDIQNLLTTELFRTHNKIIIGWWSNILITKNVKGIVLYNNIQGKAVIEQNSTSITLRVGWGELRHPLVIDLCKKGRRWLENLALIPWSVGAAPVQNIGAYGVELESSLISVEGIHMETGEIKTYTKQECELEYRNSIFKSKLKNVFFITHVTIQLYKRPNPHMNYEKIAEALAAKGKNKENLTPIDIAEVIMEIRQQKLPDFHKIWTAGSFFKTPIVDNNTYKKLKMKFPHISAHHYESENNKKQWKLSAWQLLELCNCKWIRHWNVWTYEKHALVVINYGEATGKEIRTFAQELQSIVKNITNIRLEPEVNII